MPKIILFICKGNACRSRIAEAVFNQSAPEGWKAESAGYDPVARGLNPPVEVVLREKTIPFRIGPGRRVTSEMVQQASLVVRLCSEAVPELDGSETFWDVQDPSPGRIEWRDDKADLEAHRLTRDRIAALIEGLLAHITAVPRT